VTSDYFCVLQLNPALDRDGLRRLALLACMELYRVEWLRAWLSDDGARLLCWYRAPDAEAVRLVLRQQGTGGVRVWPCEAAVPGAGVPPDAAPRGIVLELDERSGALQAALDALRGAGGGARVLAGAGEGALACVTAPEQAEATTAALRAAGLIPSRVWPCTEIDPRPTPLFENAPDSTAPAESRGIMPPMDAGTDAAQFDAVIIGAGL
jgi:hypothetical protein